MRVKVKREKKNLQKIPINSFSSWFIIIFRISRVEKKMKSGKKLEKKKVRGTSYSKRYDEQKEEKKIRTEKVWGIHFSCS